MTRPNRPTAHAYSAASNTGAAQGPLDWGDRCFLCSNTINIDTPPIDAREFYISRNGGMYLCHSACIDEMNRAGGSPKDFHAARQAAGTVQPTQEQAYVPEPPKQEQGPGWLHFGNLQDYNAYLANHIIPETAKITIGQQLVQAGE